MAKVKRQGKHLPPRGSQRGSKCETKWCRNPKPRQNGYLLKTCWKCKSRQLKKLRPLVYVLNMLRHSAKKRGLPFTLTLAQFKEFCERTDYLAQRGREPNSLTVDRINPDDGYHIHNIRVLPFLQNCLIGAAHRHPRDPDNEPF